MQAWREFDDANKAWLTVYAVIPYQKIIDIDELGDDYISVPHVIVSATDVPDAISGYFWSIKAINWGQAQGMDDGERVERFPGAVRPIPR